MMELQPVDLRDLETLYMMQRECFARLYRTYRDEQSPYLESRQRILEKFTRADSVYYWIMQSGEKIGFLRIQLDEKHERAWFSIIGILPAYRGKGYGIQAVHSLEILYPTVQVWTLSTILQEPFLVQFYEKLGYKVSHFEAVQEDMDLVYMSKESEAKA